jgi:hypothetical protein
MHDHPHFSQGINITPTKLNISLPGCYHTFVHDLQLGGLNPADCRKQSVVKFRENSQTDS